MLRAKIGRQGSNSSLSIPENAEMPADVATSQRDDAEIPEAETQRRADVCRGIDGNLEKLDALIDKAEKAHDSMQTQRKQMDKFLK